MRGSFVLLLLGALLASPRPGSCVAKKRTEPLRAQRRSEAANAAVEEGLSLDAELPSEQAAREPAAPELAGEAPAELAVAQRAAARPGAYSPSLSAGLKRLKDSEFAVIAPGKFMTRRLEAVFERGWKQALGEVKEGKVGVWHIYDGRRRDEPDWETDSAPIRGFLMGFERKLQKAFPEDRVRIGWASLKVIEGRESPETYPHIDRNYPYFLVASYTFEQADPESSRNTVIYHLDERKEAVETIQTGPRTAAIFSGIARPALQQTPGGVHGAPSGAVRRRVALFINVLTDRIPTLEDLPESFQELMRAREDLVARLLQASGTPAPARPANRR